MDTNRKAWLLQELVQLLAEERGMDASALLGEPDLWPVFRALVNTREPLPASERLLDLQDELLQGLLAERGIHAVGEGVASPSDGRLLLWRGDITTLAIDAIVNAANSQMLGCWVPGHHCIDNAIHTFAGVQLRLACADIMGAQGHEEPTGQAKVTDAYNLPSKRVIHTVGPIANGYPTPRHRVQLASCYRSCLDAVAAEDLHSLAFCCISTGIFGFPQQEAAQIAVRTVSSWLDEHDADMTVVFNVFGEDDERIYRELLGL
ncbi:MAG: protein-ADP-ribose hydrolase [Atopobiaceae bacterium]|nr:protein-ADP-ribose hydrolase [Atopobiaceae bacterium]